jgi:hypothetical protein
MGDFHQFICFYATHNLCQWWTSYMLMDIRYGNKLYTVLHSTIYSRPWHSSGWYLLAYDRLGPGSIPDKFMPGSRWMKWHWSMLLSWFLLPSFAYHHSTISHINPSPAPSEVCNILGHAACYHILCLCWRLLVSRRLVVYRVRNCLLL